jgi:predicted RecA/RadA family phage recombinase
MAKTRRWATGAVIDYTPSSAVSAGTPVQIAGVVGIAVLDIPANVQGSLAADGHFKGAKAAVAVTAGDVVGWDADGDAVGGDAGTGAYTNVSGDWDFMVGTVLYDAAETAEDVVFDLNVFPNENIFQEQAANVAAAAAQTQQSLTDSSGGTASTTIAAITQAANAGSADVGPTADAIADLAAQLAKVKADVAEVRTQLNAEIAALKAAGLQASA